MLVIALAAVAALGWGASDFFGGDSSGRGLPVFTVVAVSELLGTVALIPVLAVRGPPDLDGPAAALAVIAGIAVTAGLMTGDPLSPVIAAGLACAVLGGDLAYAAASRQGALSVVSAVSSLYPLSTISLGRLLRGTRARLPQLAGAAVALLGAGLLSSAVR